MNENNELDSLEELWREQEAEEAMLELMTDEEIKKYVRARYGVESK